MLPPSLAPRSTFHFIRPELCPPSSADLLHVERALLGRLLGSLSLLARDNVGSVPVRPVVLRGGRFVVAMMLLCLSQELGQIRDVEVAQSSSRQPSLDLLEQKAVPVRIAERGKCSVGATVRVRARHACPAEAGEMKRLTHVGAPTHELLP